MFKIFLKYYSRVKKRKEEEKIEEEILKSLKQQLNKAQNHLVALEELIVIEFRWRKYTGFKTNLIPDVYSDEFESSKVESWKPTIQIADSDTLL